MNRNQKITLTVGELLDMLTQAGSRAGLRNDEAEIEARWIMLSVKDKIE